MEKLFELRDMNIGMSGEYLVPIPKTDSRSMAIGANVTGTRAISRLNEWLMG